MVRLNNSRLNITMTNFSKNEAIMKLCVTFITKLFNWFKRRRLLKDGEISKLKQHLKIKRFWGTTENAVRIQIAVAIITYCLVAIVHHDMKLECSTYEVLQILSISLTDKTHLTDLFDKTKFNDVKELDCPLFPGLFD